MHADGHVTQLGAFGAYAFGARKGVLEVFVSETLAITVPATVKIVLTGALQRGVMARDVFHHLVRVLGPASCAFKAVELSGPVIDRHEHRGPANHGGRQRIDTPITAQIQMDARRSRRNRRGRVQVPAPQARIDLRGQPIAESG